VRRGGVRSLAAPQNKNLEGCEMRSNGVQFLIPGTFPAEALREERRRVWRELGLTKMEREGRSILVGKRRVKAWRIAGTPEFAEHARKVAQVCEAFSLGA
jgi:hypothetical protein